MYGAVAQLGKQLKNDEDRKRLATEVSYLYAPLAHRLGLYTIKSELEDLSLKYTEHDVYYHIKDNSQTQIHLLQKEWL